MLIDIIFVLIIVLACFKGLSKGFIMAAFSVLGFIIGLAAALKLSAVVASKISVHTGEAKWLPVLSFALVFIAVGILIRIVGKLIQKTFETVMLGWANRLAGLILYALLYSIIFSIFLFYAVQLHFISTATVAASVVYPFIQPLGPKVIEGLGTVIPWFKNMFAGLESFFSSSARAGSPK